MKNPFVAVDDALLRICTRFSHKLQRTVGLTNYFIAKIGVAMAALSLLAEILNYSYKFLRYYHIGTFALAIDGFLLLSMILRTLHLSEAENNLDDIKPAALKGYTGSLGWRIFWLIALLVDWIAIARPPREPRFLLAVVVTTFFSNGMLIFYYFVEVNPLPPAKSKLKEWLEKFYAAKARAVTVGA